jgi:serine/threonine protein kinase
MGVVYLAEQEEPLRRHVALKLIRRGRATADVLRRFRSEIETLAQMSHPGIARVYDAGATDDGHPYFVMEYVEGGVPITDHADERRLGIRERLELFIRLCEAVQHAHQKGVIHRDIKPSNILVTSNTPAGDRLRHRGAVRSKPEKTIVAGPGQIIGTPGCEPEQLWAARCPSTRAHRYLRARRASLQLLVGVMPFEIGLSASNLLDAPSRSAKRTSDPGPAGDSPGGAAEAGPRAARTEYTVSPRPRGDSTDLSRRSRRIRSALRERLGPAADITAT